jgi:hypothetical protein
MAKALLGSQQLRLKRLISSHKKLIKRLRIKKKRNKVHLRGMLQRAFPYRK